MATTPSFGYGHQLFDEATISRETQQTATRSALLEALTKAVKMMSNKSPEPNRLPRSVTRNARCTSRHRFGLAQLLSFGEKFRMKTRILFLIMSAVFASGLMLKAMKASRRK